MYNNYVMHFNHGESYNVETTLVQKFYIQHAGSKGSFFKNFFLIMNLAQFV